MKKKGTGLEGTDLFIVVTVQLFIFLISILMIIYY